MSSSTSPSTVTLSARGCDDMAKHIGLGGTRAAPAKERDDTPAGTPRQGGPDKKVTPCKFFSMGTCDRGDSCEWNHDAIKEAQKNKGEICVMFTKGKCKFGKKCKYSHGNADEEQAAERAVGNAAAKKGCSSSCRRQGLLHI